MLSEYVPTLEEKHIKFTFDEKVCQLLAEKSCNGASGARDLRNTIRREVEEKIANAMIEQVQAVLLQCTLQPKTVSLFFSQSDFYGKS